MALLFVEDEGPIARNVSAGLEPVVGAVVRAATVREARKLIDERRDLHGFLVDLGLGPDGPVAGLRIAKAVRDVDPDVPLAIYTGNDDREVRAVCARFQAVHILKPDSVTHGALRTFAERVARWPGVRATPPPPRALHEDPVFAALRLEAYELASSTLTPTQLRVFEELATGADSHDIMESLDISETTLRSHTSAIREKLRAPSVSAAVMRVMRAALARRLGA